MAHEYILWIATAAYALHMIEETIYDWHGWVRRVLKLQAEWNEFYMVNGFVIVLGISCAMIGWRQPMV
ncbi:MAG: HXXEE domain-containing protein, partial [Gemmatimonadaceae bacterium]|nr:HXXEE domain-containing protein [Acetobacteraceae bacterium]